MKKLLLLGLGASATEGDIQDWLGRFGQVCKVTLCEESAGKAPACAVVEMDITDATAAFIISRIRRIWRHGSLVSAHALIR